MSYAGIYEVDQSFGNTGFCHDVSGQNEERDGKKQEFTDSEYIFVATIVRDVPE